MQMESNQRTYLIRDATQPKYASLTSPARLGRSSIVTAHRMSTERRYRTLQRRNDKIRRHEEKNCRAYATFDSCIQLKCEADERLTTDCMLVITTSDSQPWLRPLSTSMTRSTHARTNCSLSHSEHRLRSHPPFVHLADSRRTYRLHTSRSNGSRPSVPRNC
jgi:hypothetical protein